MKFNSLSFIFIFSFCSFWSLAQIAAPRSLVSENEATKSLHFNNYIQGHSNTFYNTFLYSFVNGNAVPAEVTQRMAANTYHGNRLGYMAHNDVRYRVKLQKEATSIQFFELETGYSRFANARLSRNLTEIALLGNRSFENRWADFGNSSFRYLNYHYIKASYTTAINANLLVQGGFSLLNVQQAMFGEITSGGMFTAENGAGIHTSLQGNVFISDTSKSGFFHGEGFGVAADLGFEYFLEQNGETNKSIRFQMNQFGAIFTNKNSSTYQVDDNYNWLGYNVRDIFRVDQSEINGFGPDTILKDLQSKEQKQGATMAVPARMVGSFNVKHGNTEMQIFTGHYFFANALPFLGAEYRSKSNNGWLYSSYAMVGGYGLFSVGGGFGYQWKQLLVNAGTYDIQGILLPNRLAGISAYLRLNYTLQ